MSLEVQAVTYSPAGQGNQPILKEINLKAETGAITLLIGSTGAGKSTLLSIMAGIRAPDKGQVSIDNQPLWRARGIPDPELTRRLGYVYQYPEHQFFLPTVRKELHYSLKGTGWTIPEQEQRILQAIKQCRFDSSYLERSPFHLSGGEKRKLALASVFATQPDWMFLDEPTAGLDSDFSEWLINELLEYKHTIRSTGGIVVATHDLDLFLPIADSIAVLVNGKLKGPYSPAELVHQPHILEDAGIGIPASIQLAAWVSRAARTPHSDITPVQLGATYVAKTLKQHWAHLPPPRVSSDRVNTQRLSAAGVNTGESSSESPYEQLDPRSKWGTYLLFSIVIMICGGWRASIIGLIITFFIAAKVKVPVQAWRRPMLPFLLFIGMAFMVSGLELRFALQLNPLAGTGFRWEQGYMTFERLLPLLPVLAGGIIFSYTTSPMSMKKGLEAVFRPIPGLRRAGEQLALATSIMFRFIQMIPTEIERFALLASSRGKKPGKPGRIRLVQLPAFVTPLLLSIMLAAEELSSAMEARGYGQPGIQRTNAAPLRFSRMDAALCLYGIGVSILIVTVTKLT